MAVTKLDFPYLDTPRRQSVHAVDIPSITSEEMITTDPSIKFGDVLNRLNATCQNLELQFDPELKTLWCRQTHPHRPCFSMGLLRDVLKVQLQLKELLIGVAINDMPLKHLVWSSSLPGIYNLGGDLDYFCKLIRTSDIDGLRQYAKLCIDICYLNEVSLGLPILTTAFVQGDALGGGFESALSNDYIVAEEGTKFGLPEVIFNLFPGMGAYSFLSRRIGGSRARDMIVSGRLYTAEDLHEMGVVDKLAPPGQGLQEMCSFIESCDRRQMMLSALAKVGRRCSPVSYDELTDVAELWVETAIGLNRDDLRRMERLTAAQTRRRERASGDRSASCRD